MLERLIALLGEDVFFVDSFSLFFNWRPSKRSKPTLRLNTEWVRRVFRASVAQGRDQVFDFGLDFFRMGNCWTNRFAQQLTVALAQTVYGNRDRAGAHA